jgi:hypothetical protein
MDVLGIQQRTASLKSQKLALQRLALVQRVQLYLALGGDWGA